MDKTWEAAETLRECLGDETLLEELLRAMDCDELGRNLVWIATCYDIDIDID